MPATANIEPFKTLHIADIQDEPLEKKWLIENLWLKSGVGILGGAPKVCKTFLAAEISLTVATNGSLLGQKALQNGNVLFYAAEDSLGQMRSRFDGLALVRNLSLKDIPIRLVDIRSLRLEEHHDVQRLRKTVECEKPLLLVLDPFIRLARIDENSASDVSSVLGSLRQIQRDYDVAVLVVHHARKSPAAHPNLALRGSSDFAAWADSHLYLAGNPKRLTLSVQHRSAFAPEPIHCHLAEQPALHIALTTKHLLDDQTSSHDPLKTEIAHILDKSSRPFTTLELCEKLHRRKAIIIASLESLQEDGTIEKNKHGWIAKRHLSSG